MGIFPPLVNTVAGSTAMHDHVAATWLFNKLYRQDCRFAHKFCFSAPGMSGSFAPMGLGHAHTTFATVKDLLERTKLCSSCFKSYRDTILVCLFGGYVSWGVLFSYLKVGCTAWPIQLLNQYLPQPEI